MNFMHSFKSLNIFMKTDLKFCLSIISGSLLLIDFFLGYASNFVNFQVVIFVLYIAT